MSIDRVLSKLSRFHKHHSLFIENITIMQLLQVEQILIRLLKEFEHRYVKFYH
jgi:hypothetical protein